MYIFFSFLNPKSQCQIIYGIFICYNTEFSTNSSDLFNESILYIDYLFSVWYDTVFKI